MKVTKLAVVGALVLVAAVVGLMSMPGTAAATHITVVTIDSAAVDLLGNLVVNGTVSCNEGSSDQATIDSVSATQGATTSGVPTISPNGSATGPCTATGETYPWTATLPPVGGAWNGTQTVSVTAISVCCGDVNQGSSVSATTVLNVFVPTPCKAPWFLQAAPAGDLFDKNGDGYICTMDIPGSGDGNSANSQRGAGQTGFHVDGHNHKDNK